MSKETVNHDDIAQSMFGVFEQKAQDVTFDKGVEGGSIMFNPQAKDAEEQTWRGIVKFIPNIFSEGMNKHIIKKTSYWISDGDGGNGGVRWDSPRSIGEKCLVNDKYWELKNSKNVMLQEKAKNIVYQPRTFALIQIIRDMQDESNNGKIMVWALPQAIEKRINEQMFPSKKDVEMGAEANNVFNPVEGYPMSLRITVENVERDGKPVMYRNYDSCKFQNKALGIIVEGEDKPVKLSEARTSKAIQTQMIETMKKGANLQDYAYVEPTEKDEKNVREALEALVTGKPAQAEPTEVKEEVKAEKSEKEVRGVEAKAEPKKEAKAEKKADTVSDEDKMLADLGMDIE